MDRFIFISSLRLGFFTETELMFKRSEPTNAALVANIRAGNRSEEQALLLLIKRNYPQLRQFILRHQGQEVDAEDIFQEALTALVLNVKKGSFKGESSIHTYLFAIGKSLWYKRFGRESRRSEKELALVQEDVEKDTAEFRLLDTERREQLGVIFDRLKEKCKAVLLSWANGFSMQEIAKQLDYTSAQVVMNKKNKCLKELHQMIHHDPSLAGLLKSLL